MTLKQTRQDKTLLRQDAERQLGHTLPTLVNGNADEELLHELIHELGVHKIELEMQNEALRLSQAELETTRDRYLDFYDSAPFAYLTLNQDATIAEINFAGAALLGMERGKLMQRKFSTFVAQADRMQWQSYFMAVLLNDSKQSCELRLQSGDGSNFQVQLDCLRLERKWQETVVRIALFDISKRKLA